MKRNRSRPPGTPKQRRRNCTIELAREMNGRWIAEIRALPGVLAYGKTRAEAKARVEALAGHVIRERLEHGEATPEIPKLGFLACECTKVCSTRSLSHPWPFQRGRGDGRDAHDQP